MSTTKSTIYRITGLPVGPEDEIVSSLKKALYLHASNSELERIGKMSVVPSCYDNQASVGLLEWKGGAPDFLSSLVTSPLGSWEIELDDYDISFDRHFFGITQLYNTEPEQPINAELVL